MYTAIKGIFENGSVTFLEPVPKYNKTEVIVTFLENKEVKQNILKRIPGSLKRLGDLKGKKYNIPDNFNDPIDDLKEYM